MYFAHPIDFFALPISKKTKQNKTKTKTTKKKKKKKTNLSGMVSLLCNSSFLVLILIRAISEQSINNKMVSKI